MPRQVAIFDAVNFLAGREHTSFQVFTTMYTPTLRPSLLARLVGKKERHLLGNASPGFASMGATHLQKADSDPIESP